jgi:glutamine---fructose-6-phosphate transaminase (isomerizing)
MVDHDVEPGRLMRAEIAEQPERWGILLDTQRDALLAAARLVIDGRVASVVLVGRGSSDHAAIYGQYLVEMVLGRPAGLATPSVTSLLGRDLFDSSTLVVAVSQSGSSPDLVATVESARRSGSPTLSLTNDATSDLARAADVHVDLCAGPELSVAATKSYTAELVALHAWVRLAAGEPFDVVRDDVAQAAAAAKVVVERSVGVARAAAAELVDADRVLIIGRGYSLATAKEAALKLIETCALAASGWSAADAKHGPLGQVVAGTPVFLLAASEFGRESVLVIAPDVVARGGRVFPVGVTVADLEGEQGFSHLFPVVHEALVPMLEIIPMQQLALELALLRGRDPDRPTGLTKVTRTL